MSESTLLAVNGPIATLSLNRPDARNALSISLLASMSDRVRELRSRGDVRVLVMRGEGRAFCAGMDLKAVLGDPDAPLALLSSLARLTLELRTLPMVTLASVNGAAIGGGCGLACVCDIAVTHEDSKMGFPEVDLGVCPAVVAPWLVRKIGAGRARRVLLSGGVMSGKQALECGIVDQAVATPELLAAETTRIAERLASGGPHALRATKALLNEIDGSASDALVMKGAEISASVLKTAEAQERLRAKLG